MAKIKIVGDALAIVSEKTLEDIKLLEKYSPKTLVVTETDEDGQKNEVFSVSTTSGKGAANQFGVCFNGTTHEGKKAVVTVNIPGGIADVKAYAEDNYGVAVSHLNEIESRFEEALAQVAQKRKAVQDSIELI